MFTEAAKYDIPDALYYLGLLYSDAEGVDENKPKAIQIWGRALLELQRTDPTSYLIEYLEHNIASARAAEAAKEAAAGSGGEKKLYLRF